MNLHSRIRRIGLCLALAFCAATASAATNRWDGASGLRPEQMRYHWALKKGVLTPMPGFTNGILTLASPNGPTDSCYYNQSGERLAMPSQLIIEARLRFVSGDVLNPARTPAAVGFTVSPNVGSAFAVGQDEIFLLHSYNGRGASAVVDTDGEFHTYRIEVNGLTEGSAIKVYYDGALKLTAATFSDARQGVDLFIWWGDGSQLVSGVSEWQSFAHNAAAFPAVWGVKTYESPWPSGSPATLFHFAEDGSYFAIVAPITLAGALIDVDGLAVGMDAVLYGFQVQTAGSRLIKIDKSTAAATVVGPTLANRNIRGAAGTLAGRIMAIDAATNQIVQVDPATGALIGDPVALQLTNASGKVANVTDLAQVPDGSFVLAWNYNELYTLDIHSGAARLLYRDTVADPQCAEVSLDGLAYSRDADPDALFAYEICLRDDLYMYRPAAGYSRSTLWANIIPGYNAGRGDLATLPPMDCQILSLDVAPHSQVLRVAFPANCYAWVEWKADLNEPSWHVMTNSMVSPSLDNERLFSTLQWTIVPAFESNVFFHVGTSLNSL